MLRLNSTASSLVLAALLAIGVGLLVENWSRIRGGSPVATSAAEVRAPVPAKAGSMPTAVWAASAPGRVEPYGGEIRISPQVPGRIVAVLVRLNDSVKRDDPLVRLADDDALARLSIAEAEAAVRRRERDAEPVPRVALDRRQAEDLTASSERALHAARMELDRLITARRNNDGNGNEDEIAKARTVLTTAIEKFDQDRVNLRKIQSNPSMPLPTRLESALTTARAEISLAEAAVERTRLRAPDNGSVLQVNARVGEIANVAAEEPMILFGDTSRLRVRAEIEERDVGKIRVGQAVIIRAEAVPGTEFNGRVERMGGGFVPPQLGATGPRRPALNQVLEVFVDLEGRPPLLPGMRVDVFFRPDAVGADPKAVTKTN